MTERTSSCFIKCTRVLTNTTHLPVFVIGGVRSQDAGDLHIGVALLQESHHVLHLQLSTRGDPVQHLWRNTRPVRLGLCSKDPFTSVPSYIKVVRQMKNKSCICSFLRNNDHTLNTTKCNFFNSYSGIHK